MQRRYLFVGGLLVAACLVWAAQASDQGSGRAKPPPSITDPPNKDCPDGQCGKHGTTVAFEDSPTEAAKKAKKQEKLVLVLHVSGLFEDPKLT
jgi:hypothetical protein